MKLVVEPNVYPLIFVIWGGNSDFNGLFEELQKHKIKPAQISEVMEPMVDDMERTAGFRLDFGNVQAVWVPEKLTWRTMDTYDQEAWCYMNDYLIRQICKTKFK